MKGKKLLSVLLLVVYIFSILPVAAQAGPEIVREDDNLTFTTTATTGTTGTLYSVIGWTVKLFTNGTWYNTRIQMQDDGNPIDNHDGTMTYNYIIPFSDPAGNYSTNTILNRFIYDYTYKTPNSVAVALFKDFFRHGGTLYLDGVFTIKENGVPQGSMDINGYLSGETYWEKYGINGIKDARSWGAATQYDLDQYWNLNVDFPPQAFPIKAIAAYWGIKNDGTIVNLLPGNEEKYTGSTTLGDPVTVPVKLSRTFPEYTFKESKLSYDGTSYFDIIPGDPGKNRSVTMDENHDTVYVYFTFKQNPPPGTPSLGISANKTAVEPGESYTIIDESEPSQGATVIISWTIKELFTPKGGWPVQTLQSKTIINPAEFFKGYSKTNEGTYEYIITHVEDDAGNEIAGSASVSVTVGAAAPPPPSGIPVAIITAPATARAGESITVSGSSSYSPNGPIETYTWSNGGGIGTPDSVSGMITYMYAGTYTIGLTVTDSAGMSASATKTIAVTPPTPSASFVVGGTLKENRKVVIDAGGSASSPYYPIDHALTQWIITPVSGGGTEDIKYTVPLNGNASKYILFKKAGTYKITLTVKNSYGLTDSTERTVTIQPDLAPDAQFDAPSQVLRDPVNGKKAAISLTDESISPDGDLIGKRVWTYAYDSNNDGSFSGETFTALDGSNKTSLTFTAGEVGKYLVRETVTEEFGQATIPEFVTAADYKTDSYEYTVEVINTAPVSSLKVKKLQNVDLTVVTDFVGAKLTTLTNQLSSLKSSIFSKDVNLNYTVVDGNNKVQVGEFLNTNRLVGTMVAMDPGSEYNYGWLGAFFPQIWITPSGTTSRGNGSPNNIVSVSTSSTGKMFCAVDANGNLYGWGEQPESYLCPFPRPDDGSALNTLINFNGTYTQYNNYQYNVSGISVKDAFCLDNAIIALNNNGTLEVHGNDSFHKTTYVAAGEGKYYGGKKVIDSDVVQVDGSGYTVIYLKSDGSVWGVGENQYFSAGPYASMWQQTWSGLVLGYGFNTGKNKIPGLPKIKKILHSTILSQESTATGTYQGRMVKQTSFAIDGDNRVWMWGFVLPGTGITANSARAHDGYHVAGKGIECIREPVIIPGLDGSDIADISYGTYCTDPSVTSYARSSHTLMVLKTDGTLWHFNNGALKRATSEAYTDSSNYRTNHFTFDRVYAIGSSWYLTAEGTMFGVRGSAWSNFPRYSYLYGINPEQWLNPVYGPNLDSINMSGLRPGSDRYFMWVSDGQENNYSSGYGNYFGLGNLSEAFAVKLRDANYAGIVVTPGSSYTYMSGLPTQELTIQELFNSPAKSGRYYNAGEQAVALMDLQDSYAVRPEDVANAYVLVNEDRLAYIPYYSDYENDPKNLQAWYYEHTPAYFENSQGAAPFIEQWMGTPIETFDKVGLYKVKLRSQDNPKNNARFMDYWLWGAASPNFIIIAHRRPIADFSYTIRPGGGSLTLQTTNISYDLDHISEDNKGIAASRWKYKKATDSAWTNGLPATLATNAVYQISLEVQDLEGAWSNPAIKVVDTANLPPLVDASPASYDGSGPVHVTITADDLGENDFSHTKYAWTQSTVKPTSWTASSDKVINTSRTTDGIWYLHMEAFDTAGNSTYVYRGPYKIVTLAITGVSISGYWNHWRGQIDLFGKQLTNEPHRFLSLETVKIDVATTGNADKVVIRFSPELEAMQFTDQYGNRYDYRDDFFGYYVNFPEESTFTLNSAQMNNAIHWEYTLPLAPSSVSWEDKRLRGQYSMTVTVYKGADSVSYTINDIDITGNVYDLTYIQPLGA